MISSLSTEALEKLYFDYIILKLLIIHTQCTFIHSAGYVSGLGILGKVTILVF